MNISNEHIIVTEKKKYKEIPKFEVTVNEEKVNTRIKYINSILRNVEIDWNGEQFVVGFIHTVFDEGVDKYVFELFPFVNEHVVLKE